MPARRLPLFCDTTLAGRIERAEAQVIAEASRAAQRCGFDLLYARAVLVGPRRDGGRTA